MTLQNVINKLQSLYEPKRFKKERITGRLIMNHDLANLVQELSALSLEVEFYE